MSILYLIRHGQASFLEENYDRLSKTGIEQAARLGQFWNARGIDISEVYSGDLERQKRTAQSAGEAYQSKEKVWPDSHDLPGLNEYDSESIMNILLKELTDKSSEMHALELAHRGATTPIERYRTFHCLLEAVMKYYVAGEYESVGFETWPDFKERVMTSFHKILQRKERGRNVAVFTSGGPIGLFMQSALRSPDQTAVELHWRIHNASVTQFTFSGERLALDTFNSIAHLPPELATYR